MTEPRGVRDPRPGTEPRPLTIVGLSGSLRQDSANTALLHAARELVDDTVAVEVHHLGEVPPFDADVEASGLPAPVVALRDAVADADGLLLASPEYNRSVSGVLKNAIDWLSRGDPAPLDHAPTALLSAAGGSGGRRAQRHLREILGHNQVDVIDRAVQLSRAGDHVDEGRLVGDDARSEVAEVVAALVARIRSRIEATADGGTTEDAAPGAAEVAVRADRRRALVGPAWPRPASDRPAGRGRDAGPDRRW